MWSSALPFSVGRDDPARRIVGADDSVRPRSPIHFPLVRPSQQIIHADPIIVRQLDENVNRIIQYADFILRICVLLHVQNFGDLLLCQTVVNSQIADILKFQNFITHSITRYEHISSENKILLFILFSDIIPIEVIAMPNYQAMYLRLFNAVTDAIESLEQQNYGAAKEQLIRVQQETEELYISET